MEDDYVNKLNEKAFEKFCRAVMSFEAVEDCRNFFDDIFTIQEMEAISQRLEVACLLSEGKSYVEVNKATGASTATICRVAKCINYGNGGYMKAIENLKEES
ncbi:MAG: TrpR-like protein YerC/YecD [Clostridia bacterium]|nr:TrpR-like protein YerC/YecD [Clostridia bacterium]MBR2079092.1 TrpR-like protein YerC/YecD [Clostridia bacterium]